MEYLETQIFRYMEEENSEVKAEAFLRDVAEEEREEGIEDKKE
jgi:hypothetical protein